MCTGRDPGGARQTTHSGTGDHNRELEAFSYSVSHDLRAPLRTIDGFSLALEEDYVEAMDAAGRDYIHRVRTGVQRMGQFRLAAAAVADHAGRTGSRGCGSYRTPKAGIGKRTAGV